MPQQDSGREQRSPKHLSTSALARAIGKEGRELFILLAQSGWIVKADGHWQLTEKGRFEGGVYVNHPKFGEYIAWPASVREHPVLRLLPEAPLTARQLAQKFHLPARLVNLVLAERGWIKRHVHGWLLTEAGAAVGGQQRENEATAIPYVTWPETLLDNTAFTEAVAALRPGAQQCLDGHSHNDPALMVVDNWLYVAGMVHAVDHSLSWRDEGGQSHRVSVDFYLPALGAAIVYWPAHSAPGALADTLDKREQLRASHWTVIELQPEDLEQLDEVLTRELMKLGCAVY